MELNRRIIGAGLALVAALSAGCGSGDKPDAAADSAATNAPAAAGDAQISGELPDGWPSEFPIPDGATFIQGGSQGTTMTTAWTAPANADLGAYFRSELAGRGWTVENEMPQPNGLTIHAVGHGWRALVITGSMGPGGDQTLSVALTQE